MDVGPPAIATVSVTLPPKAPQGAYPHRRARTSRTARTSTCSWSARPIAIGPCRIATHLLVKGRAAGYGFARLARRDDGAHRTAAPAA